MAGPEASFPYPDGGIGAWGFDIVRGELRDPADYRDFMGYCDPSWTSDYAYGRIFDRIQTIRSASVRGLDEPLRARAVIVDVDGSLSWGSETLFFTEPDGEPITATWDSPDGTRRTVVGTLSRVSDLPGGVIYVPVPDAPAVRLDLGVLGSLAMD